VAKESAILNNLSISKIKRSRTAARSSKQKVTTGKKTNKKTQNTR